jgi:hypothetical protein
MLFTVVTKIMCLIVIGKHQTTKPVYLASFNFTGNSTPSFKEERWRARLHNFYVRLQLALLFNLMVLRVGLSNQLPSAIAAGDATPR